jgi:hypothetical protein
MKSWNKSTQVPFVSRVEYRAATTLFGTLSGAALGSFAGGPGALSGALIGAIVGAMASVVLDGQDADIVAHERRLEAETAGISPRRPRVLWRGTANPRHSWAGI